MSKKKSSQKETEVEVSVNSVETGVNNEQHMQTGQEISTESASISKDSSADPESVSAKETQTSDQNMNENSTTEEEKEKEQKKEKPEPHHVSHFKHYINQVKDGKAEGAIKSLNLTLKNMLTVGTNEAFNDVYNMYTEEKSRLAPKVIMQAIASIPANERAVIEVVTTIFHVIHTDKKNASKNISLEHARKVVKNEAFINWLARKIS